MAEPFLGQIIIVGFGYAPKGYAECNGQLMQASQNAALASLLGTQFGGDGITTFALPNLCGRVPIGPDYSPIIQGYFGGQENVTLDLYTMAAHRHIALAANEPANRNVAGGANDLLGIPNQPIYVAPINLTSLNDMAITPTTSTGSPHINIQPSLCVRFAIATSGTYPQRS